MRKAKPLVAAAVLPVLLASAHGQNAAVPAAQTALPPAPAAAPSTAAAPAAAPSTPATIASLQQRLKQQGYFEGPVNGVMSGRTQRAIAAYRRRSGPAAVAGADAVAEAQEGLRGAGIFAGPVDGVIGPETRDAIIRFEAARHLPIDPRVSDTLLAALAAAGAAPRAAAPAAASPATPGTAPPATGRQPLPAGLNPPLIR